MFLIFLPGTSLGAFFCIFPGTFTRKLLVTFFSFSTLLLFPALSSSYFGITSLGIQVSLSLCYQIIQNTVQIFLLVLERRRRPAISRKRIGWYTGSPRSSIILTFFIFLLAVSLTASSTHASDEPPTYTNISADDILAISLADG